MMKLGLIGCGGHSRDCHLPALERFTNENPGTVELAMLCDVDDARCAEFADRYRFAATCSDWQYLLTRVDAIMAITPPALTVEVAEAAAELGIPVLLEKPLGENEDDLERIRDASHVDGASMMVSMNRRFSPGFVAAMDWLKPRQSRLIRAIIARENRTETEFVHYTGIHLVDAVCALGGSVRPHTVDVKKESFGVRLAFDFVSGCQAEIEILPTLGVNRECIEAYGDGFRVEACAPAFDTGVTRAWVDGELALAMDTKDEPRYIRDGTYAETCAFITAARGKHDPWPQPDDVAESIMVCELADRLHRAN